ncbi:MAG: carboxypeptidase regulatory-like domain-containing protein, partial [Myxococcota bacterium]
PVAAPTTGVVTGQVVDPTGAPYPGLTVRFGVQAVTTDGDGRFRTTLPPGEYEVEVDVEGLFVPGELVATVALGAVTTVDVALQADDPEALEVVVYAPEVVGGVNASIAERRDATAVTEVIGAEQMAKSGDSSASAALARATGLTIVDGRFVYVRGLGDRYSSTLLNLSSLPSPEPERRVVPLDLFPTGLLESVTVYKTWSPDLPGEFGGGVVALETRGIPDRPYTQATITAGWISGTTLETAPSGFTGPTDWLGFGLGPRALPQRLDDATRDRPLVEGDLFTDGYTAEELAAIGQSVDASRWGVAERTVPPDVSVQLGIGRRIDLGGPVLGLFGGLTFGNAWSVDEYTLRFYDLGAGGALEESNSYRFHDLSNQIVLGGIANVGLQLTPDHGVFYTLFLSRSSSAITRNYRGFNADVGTEIDVTRLDWVERQLLFNQLRGEHRFPALGGFGVDWRYALSTATRDEPDQREFRYDLEEGTGQYLISDRPEGNNLLYSTLGDRNHDARLDLSLPFGSDDRPGKVAVGGQLVVRHRDVDTRRFSYFERGILSEEDRPLPPEELFSGDRIGPDGYELREVTRATDNYFADQTVKAGYVLTDFPFDAIAHPVWGLRDLSVSGGLRIEDSEQTVTTYALFDPDPDPIVARLANTDLLPSVTATQALIPATDDPNGAAMLVRAGYARTVSRPDFRELSEAPFNDVTGGREVFGNPDLERARIDHYDLRWEWYPRAGELVSLGVFRKQFHDPIETVVVPSASLSVTWQNASAATNDGIEADLRKTLAGTELPVLEHLYLAANGALIRSRIQLGDTGGVQTSNDRPLQGQSPWVANVQLGYDDGDAKTIVTASFNVAGPRIVEVGALGAPDTLEQPAPRLDLLLQQGFARDWSVRLRARNLLDPNVKLTQGDAVVREGRDGWSALVSLEWKP